MTKTQKSVYKKLKKDKHRLAFVQLLVSQQQLMGKYRGWAVAYAKKCEKKGIELPREISNALAEMRG